jgi:FlaA1/EpsC-like NDP-sugar epimerase
MGQPVRILDLARKMIFAAGFKEQEIAIEFTGRRPGEKLSEELHTLLDETLPTQHEKIRVLVEREHAGDVLRGLDRLRDLCTKRDVGGVVRALTDMVVGYTPSPELLALINEVEQVKLMDEVSFEADR